MSEFTRELTDLIRSLAQDADHPDEGQVTRQWEQVQELGLVGIGIAEEAGGSGGEMADLLVAVRELARAGIATPLVEASTAAFAIGPAEPGTFDTVVINDVVNLSAPTLTADLGIVPFAPLARRVLIVGDAVATVAPTDARIDPVIDIAGLPAGRVSVVGAPCDVRPDLDAGPIIERLALARSAALLGYALGAYELTRNYVVERQQFGAPLIKIPSVATSLAEISVRIRAAQAAVDGAVSACSDPGAESLRRFGAVASARITTAQAATLVARTTHQLHGAVGITREYGLHRYTRSLWAQRDADRSERDWCGRLGATALAVDEDALWDELTA